MLSLGSMVFSLENEKGSADEKKRKSWQAEQVQCHRMKMANCEPGATSGHQVSGVKNNFYTFT